MTGKVVEFPLDTIKVRLQTASGPKVTALSCARKIITREGFRGFYKGLASPMAGSMAENAVLFATYGQFKSLLPTNLDGTSPLYACIISGFLAGIAVAHVLTPVELIKCRLQIQDAEGATKKYKGPVDCIVKTVKQDGFRGLYKGHSATLAREMIGNALWFGCYEFFCKVFTPKGKTKDDLTAFHLMAAGALGGMSYWGIPYPIDSIKSVMQTHTSSPLPPSPPSPPHSSSSHHHHHQQHQHPHPPHHHPHHHNTNSFFNTARFIWRTKGIKGFYVGLGVTLFRAVPANATIFCTYELVARFLSGI